MVTKHSWGIIGTGSIAEVFAKAVVESKKGRLAAVASRAKETADAFANRHGILHRHYSYDSLLTDPHVEAVYISTPHPTHAEWAIKAADAGKHVLCEKPFAMNCAEAESMIEAAKRNGVFMMEAFMYRCHPQTRRIVELIRDGIIGEVRLIQASFGFRADFNPANRCFSPELGGGGILDVGCYCVSMSRLVAGTAIGQQFVDPIDVQAAGHIGETGVDEYTAAVLKFPNDIIAQVSCGVSLAQETTLRIYGTEGWVVVPQPWVPGRLSEIIVKPAEKRQKIIRIRTTLGLYAIEAHAVADAIDKRQSQAMSWEDTLGNAKTLDMWRDRLMGSRREAESREKGHPHR